MTRPLQAKPAKSEVVIPHASSWRGRWAARIIHMCVRLVAVTVRFRGPANAGDLEGVLSRPLICCVWHNRLALCLMLYERWIGRRFAGRRLAAMVSASRDGGVLAQGLKLFGVEPVRGSSSRRGRQALLEMTSWAEKGYDLAITPDGPRGPRYQIQDGIIALAQVTGLPILPASYHLNWKICLKSWDRFQVPLPLSRCTVRVAEIMRIPRETTEEEREVFRQQLERRMREITED